MSYSRLCAPGSRVPKVRLLAAAALAVAGFAPAARAATSTWNAASGNWSVAGNWIGGVPVNASVVNVTLNDAVARVVTFDVSGTGVTLNGLTLDNTGVGTNTLAQSANALTVGGSGAETVGLAGSGAFTQTGGANSVGASGGLQLGVNFSSRGAYTLANTATLNVTGGSEYVGYGGNGVFTQTGGNHAVTANFPAGMYLGYAATGAGTMNLSGGTLNLTSGSLAIGYAGKGVWNQSGGNVSAPFIATGYNGPAAGSGIPYATGSYNMTGGGVNATSGEAVGYFGVGTMTQTGGFNVTANLYLGYNFDAAAGASGVYSLGGNATLSADNAYVGYFGVGTYNQTGGAAKFGTLFIAYDANAVGTVNLSAGTLNASTVVVAAGGAFNQTGGSLSYDAFNLNGGTVTGTIQNRGTFFYSSGTFAGRLVNDGVVNLGPNFTAGNGIQNDVAFTVSGTQTLTLNGAGLDNFGVFTLAGGTLAGTGTQTNDYGGAFNAAGLVTAPLVNNGALNLTGQLTLSNTFNNAGVTTVPAGGPVLRVASFTNVGSLNVAGSVILNGAANNAGVVTLSPAAGIAGSGALTNGPGGLIQGSGGISAPLTNNGGNISATSGTPLVLSNFTGGNVNGGQLNVGPAGVLQILTPFTNASLITLSGGNASLGGGAITNTGTVKGVGNVSNVVQNAGVVRAEAGTLQLSATGNTNGPTGQIQTSTGATVIYAAGLSVNAGTIALAGGAFDNNNQPLTNSKLIVGNGVLRTGGMVNNGTVTLTDVASQVFGPVTNNASLSVISNTTTFYGPVTNNGTLKTTSAIARFLAPFTNNGIYNSDPSTQSFTDLTVGDAGALIGGQGDRFTLTGDLHSTSLNRAAWQTTAAALSFTAGGPSTVHELDVSGTDGTGYTDNYAWGTIDLAPGQSLRLLDADATPGGALYVTTLDLQGAPTTGVAAFVAAHLLNDAADPLNVYYDPAQPANAYLADATYNLGGGGLLAPAAATPEPAALLLLTASTVAWLTLRPRRRSTATAMSPKC